MSNLRLNLDEWLVEDWKNIVLEAGWGTHLNELGILLKEEYPKKNIYPSFENIFNAYNACSFQDLMHWAGQGVLLINSILTVEDSLPGSHANIGWLSFTKLILSELSQRKSGLVFMLWGNYAQKLGKDLDPTIHHIIKTSHPSPLSANRGGWFGTRPFSQANSYLDVPIQWA